MLFKMIRLEETYRLYGQGPKPRQLFVTQSRMLATKVAEYFASLVDSLTVAHRDLDALRQIAANKSSVMVDNTLIDQDDIEDWRSDLPSQFSQLKDEHFPLFLTYEHVSWRFFSAGFKNSMSDSSANS
jgi:hypothetical protein